MDGCPGRLNAVSTTLLKPGIYYGQCSELCGIMHSFMPIVITTASGLPHPPRKFCIHFYPFTKKLYLWKQNREFLRLSTSTIRMLQDNVSVAYCSVVKRHTAFSQRCNVLSSVLRHSLLNFYHCMNPSLLVFVVLDLYWKDCSTTSRYAVTPIK